MGSPGAFRAWLSTSSESALARVTTGASAGRPLRLYDGTLVAADLGDLVDAGPRAAIDVDFKGVALKDTTAVWTGTLANGSDNPTRDCAGWTTRSGQTGSIGVQPKTNSQWTEGKVNEPCGASYRIYCVELAK